jgi:hypothetical protein
VTKSVVIKLAMPLVILTAIPASVFAVDSPLGIRVGSFTVLPSFQSENKWNDNIYSRQTDTRSDFIFHLKPQVDIKSNWNRHSVGLSVGTDAMFYQNYSKEDRQNTFVTVDGKLDVLKDSFATAKLYYKNMKEDRASADVSIQGVGNPVTPLENQTFGATLGYEHKMNRVHMNLSHDINHMDFTDGVDGSGAPILNSQRTRTTNTSEVKLGYELFSGYEAYVKGVYNFVDYQHLFTKQGNLDRSSQGFNIATGVKFDLSHTVVGDAHIGYRRQDYDSPVLKTISGVSGGLGLTWKPTRLTTVTGGVDRSIQETSLQGQSGIFNTTVSSSITHELMRNILLNAHASYTNNDYHGSNPINRQEDLYNLGFNVKYLVNRHLSLNAGYDHKARSVNLNGNDYDTNIIYFTLGAHL